jgi:hypothetical protein
VFENLLFRFELWAKYNDPKSIMNNPYRTSLWSVFKESFSQGY